MIATRRAMAVIAAIACFVGGCSGFFGTLVGPTSDIDPLVRPAALLSVLASLGLAVYGRRLPLFTFYVFAEVGAALMAASIWVQRDRPDATAVAALLLMITVFLFAFFDPLAALPGLVTVLAALVLAKVWDVLPWSEFVVLSGLNVLIAAVIGWLVRAASDTDLDSLTGLLNWRGLERPLQEALSASRREGLPVTIGLLNIDGFTGIVERQGHAEADKMLRSFGRAWSGLVRSPAEMGRMSVDEFLLLIPDATPESVTALMDSLRAAAPTTCRFSAGVATYTPGDTLRTLMARADAALREAKQEGGGRTSYARDGHADAHALATGLAAGEFHVVYQPIVDVRSGRVAGAEALLRWTRPGRGPVPPDEFIPLAERCGYITRLGRWVLEAACVDAAAWPRDLPAKVTVNVSGPQLHEPEYAGQVLRILERSGLPPERLVLEVTESTLQADSTTAIEHLHVLRDHGVRIAIDDFGTGYSSLSRLQHLPADILKIDQSFVAALRPTDQNAPLIAAITALAHALGLRTVAEGVEEHYQATLLAHHGCDEAQGWLHGRPGAPERISEALAAQAKAQLQSGDLPVYGTST